jgi:DNA-binding NarL/FixJ family response regulator/anti-sigma regulatory factor (Ser/Thr protein kinase)
MGRILTIGDAALADALRTSGQLRGHEVENCADALEAACHVRRRAVDVVVTDSRTPATVDLTLSEELRRIRPGVKTIVLAPELTSSDVIDALRADVFACFTPPFNAIEIADMVRTALESSDWRDGIEVVSGLPHWLSLKVACGTVTADRLTRFLTEWRSELPSNERDLLMAAFREMLLNAMEHGAGFDEEKVIEVTAARTARAIVFHLRDPGEGFDQNDLRHAAASSHPEALLAAAQHRADTGRRPGGFGMLIVRQIVDELAYNERGNEVILIKHLA